ncbi:MAG: glycine cleavage system protein GcvH [Acidimicrobiia bacterium]|nr:glycine cleavage system protein GcvH [Acidimicrobiia bacterium]
MNVPAELRYSEDHEWARVEGNRVFLGITDYAQDALGDVVYIDLPPVGTEVAGGQSFSEIESTKSVSEIYAPVSGTVIEVNTDLIDHPERLNEDPYGEGWICVIEASDLSELDGLLDAAAYTELTESVD